MGIQLEAAPAVANQQITQNALDAPLRLREESYESFARLLPHLGQDEEVHAGVVEELRQLQIDPENFYRGAQRLGVRRFSVDDLDPTAGPRGATATAEAAAGGYPAVQPAGPAEGGLYASASGGYPAHCTARSEGAGDSDRWAAPHTRGDTMCAAPEVEAADDMPTLRGILPGVPGLNAPSPSDIEDMPYEEISLDTAGAGESRGGRMGHETPRGLPAKLQIDSLTDDGDDDDFRGALIEGPPDGITGEQDEVAAFSLDPDFDYDNVDNLTTKF